MSEKATSPHVVILGAGYAGVMTAARLAGRTRGRNIAITLINADDAFVERPLLHEAATGKPPRRLPLSRFLKGTPVRFVRGIVTRLEPDVHSVTVRVDAQETRQIRYDALVYALGSHTDRDAVPGVRDYAYALDASGDRGAAALFERLNALKESRGQVVVVGSGPTGIELATQIADVYPSLRVQLITQGEFGDFKTPRVQRYMRRATERLGVGIVERAAVGEVRESEVVTAAGAYPFDALVWAGGFRAFDFASAAGLKVGEKGEILVDAYFRSVSHPSIFAVGDSAKPITSTGAPYRMGVFPAVVSGGHTADNLVRLLRGKPLQPLGFSYYGQGIALGVRDAVGFATFPDDMPIGPLYTGRLGLFIRSFFLKLIREMIVVERRFPGILYWFGRNRGGKARPAPHLQPQVKQVS